jgi:hypothetical protein
MTIGKTFSKKANMWNVYKRFNDSKQPDKSEYVTTEKEADKKIEEFKKIK